MTSESAKRRRQGEHQARRRREQERHRELQQVEPRKDGYSQDADLDDPTLDIFGQRHELGCPVMAGADGFCTCD